MDLKDFEKHIIPKIEAGRSIEAVRNIIKTGQYAEQDRREFLKETYKPITDELEKVDEGIYKLKDELKDLKAIEGPPALPAIEGSQQEAIEGLEEERRKKSTVNLDSGFSEEDLDFLKLKELEKPSDLAKLEDERYVEGALKKTGSELKSLGGKKGAISRKKE